jgi:argininosuccinate lyase
VLRDLERDGVESLPTGQPRSSLFWYVEAALIERLGERVGGKMHTGRSHNDIMPTVSRLTARGRVLALCEAVLALRTVLLTLAAEHVDTVMPGYTALQHGQPWTFGHYLHGWAQAFERDFDRLRGAYARTNLSSLGASALAGTSWPLDRHRTAELLGFDGVLANTRDAGFATRDYVAETLAATAIAMSDLDRLCADLYLWSSYEFGMVEIADGFAGTSSFMPQKKNAWAFDWARGAAGYVAAALTATLSAHRGSTSTDGSFQDYPEKGMREALELSLDYLRLVTAAIETLSVDRALMLRRAQENWTTASNLADEIARAADLSFREAHGVVGRVVRTAVADGVGPMELTAAHVDAAAQEVLGRSIGLDDALIHEALDPVRFIETRTTYGSVNPSEVRRMVTEAGERLTTDREWLDQRRAAVTNAETVLGDEVDRHLG